MSIQDQLIEDLKTAMKSGDTVTKDTVRLIRSAIKNAEIEKQGDLEESDVNQVLAKMAKQYRDSLILYREAKRDDLVTKEEAELAVVMRYQPEQMSADDVRAIAQKAIEEVGAAGPGDKGKVMGKLMPQVKGKADGSVVNAVVGELLDALAG
jgi:uncharacterized protein YqeY